MLTFAAKALSKIRPTNVPANPHCSLTLLNPSSAGTLQLLPLLAWLPLSLSLLGMKFAHVSPVHSFDVNNAVHLLIRAPRDEDNPTPPPLLPLSSHLHARVPGICKAGEFSISAPNWRARVRAVFNEGSCKVSTGLQPQR